MVLILEKIPTRFREKSVLNQQLLKQKQEQNETRQGGERQWLQKARGVPSSPGVRRMGGLEGRVNKDKIDTRQIKTSE